MATALMPSRGEIWLIGFDPSVGAEVQKLRPAVVVSIDSIGRLPLRIVAPLTDWKPAYAAYPWFVRISPDGVNGLSKESGVDAFQTKSVSVRRFGRRLGLITTTEIEDVASAIALCVGAP